MSPVLPPLPVAVVGLGIGREHARAYGGSELCSLKWLYDLDPEKSRRVAGEMGAGRVADRFEQILEDPSTRVVSIASYDDAHASQVAAALRAGKHVFVEKPLCRSLEELESIRSAWREGGKPHLRSNLVLRAAPLFAWLEKAVADGLLGQVYSFDGDYLYGRLSKITEGWRRGVERYSVMAGGGIHLVDLMLRVAREGPSSVTTAGNRICTAGTPFRERDFVSATYEFPSGLIGRITANFGCVHRHQHVVRVFGTRGTFLFDDAGARWHDSRDPESAPRTVPGDPHPASKGALIPDFVRAILGGEDPEPPARSEFDLMRVCLAADRAMDAGSRFPLDPS
jgi:predicted dehydrogenase